MGAIIKKNILTSHFHTNTVFREDWVLKKEKDYSRAVFSTDVIKEAYNVFKELVPDEYTEKLDHDHYLTVETSDGDWSHDTEEEFFSDYRKGSRNAVYRKSSTVDFYFRIQVGRSGTSVEIGFPQRSKIEAVFDVFERHLEDSMLPEPETEAPDPRIFVGHGRSPQWRDLKDHLQDQHGYEVIAYEVGARAGHTIRDILEDMLVSSSFAILVMSAEDKDAEGNFHARANVIHELGLFQGKIGFSRAIVLLEEETQEFSNIYGIQQVRFSKGNVRETFGDVLATIKREF